MKKWTLILGSFFLIASFQNCQKANLNSSPNASGGSTPSATDYNKTSASSYPIMQMWDYQGGRTLDVDVATGHVAVYLNFGQERDEDRCLTEEQTSHLQGLLSQAEVCQPMLPPEAFLNRECTMEYRAPYAILVAGADTARLGEKSNGCDVPTDLCGQNAQALRDFVSDALSNIDQQACQ